MKAEMSALKDQMASMMEAMLKIQKSIEDNATAAATNTTREAEPVLQPAMNSGRDRSTTGFNRRYSPQAYPYGLPSDFTPRTAPDNLSQAPTFEGQLPAHADYPLEEDDEGDAHLGPLLPPRQPAPHELPQPNIIRHALEQFSPIPMAYSEIWPSLLENHLVVAIPGKVFQLPYPKWYNSNATCTYHSGAPGHNIDSCLPFKYKVQHLINVDWLSFQEEGPNVKTNPLASHGGASVNAIEEDRPSRSKRLEGVAASKRFIYQSLQAACMVSRGGGKRDECLFHLGELHDMETCPVVEELLQRLMDRGQLEVSERGREEPQICMQSAERKAPPTPKPLVIRFTRNTTNPRHGYEPGMGLGKNSHGNVDVVDIRGNPHKYGLGYKPRKSGRRNAPSRLRTDRAWPGHAQGDAPQGVGAPPPPRQADLAEPLGVERYLQHLVRQQVANHREQVQIHEYLYRFNHSQQRQGSTPFVCPTPEQFAAKVAWPGDWPDAQVGEEPVGSPSGMDEPRMDEDMTDLFDFLGGSEAT
ncbi:hypothetical protein HKD37_14G040605 [Glycine soja]